MCTDFLIWNIKLYYIEMHFWEAVIINKEPENKTYWEGGRQQPASIGDNLADLYCLRVCIIGRLERDKSQFSCVEDSILKLSGRVYAKHLIFFGKVIAVFRFDKTNLQSLPVMRIV